MAAAEQPLKKRKLYDPPPSSPLRSPEPPSQAQEPPGQPQRPPTPPPLSQEEIVRRQRSQEEIRSVFECYKKIKLCIGQRDKHFKPELEEAYLSLINASGGGASVQRLVAEYIPRYASFFPAALEAAGNALTNMHNQCITVISGGEDIDGIAFETAKSCILGLVDVCRAAATDNLNSESIVGIFSAVFQDVFTFFLSTFEAKNIFDIIDQSFLRIYDVAESLSDVTREFLEEHSPILLKLSKLRGLCFLSILFGFPKYSLVACFELFESTAMGGIQKGKYLLHLLTRELDFVGLHHLDERNGDESFNRIKCLEKNPATDYPLPKGNSLLNCSPGLLKNCLLALVLSKDMLLRSLIFSRYKMLCDSASSEVVSDITAILEGVFESFGQLVKAEDNQVNSVEGGASSSKYMNQCPVSRACNQQGSPVVSGRDYPDKHSGNHLKRGSTTVNAGIDPFTGESKSMDYNYGDPGDMTGGRMFMPRELLNRQSFSPRARTPRDLRSNSFSNRFHSSQIERSPNPNMDLPAPTLRSSSGASNPAFESPKQTAPPPHSSPNHAIWYSDGDPAAMDIFPASKQLWLGSLGPNVSEMHIRFQFEKFGFIDQLRCFPFKGFATVEYRNIMDALKAREVMRGCSPWGACLRVKFLDGGLGTRGSIHGTAVGSSCHVYVGNVPSIWAKDEMIHEVKNVLHKGPRMVIDLSTEGALLLEFDSPEEATISIVHLRRHRKENSNYYQPPSNTGPPNVMMHAECAKPVPAPLVRPDTISLELRSPRMNQENCGTTVQTAHVFQPTWTGGGNMEVGRSGAAEQSWMYGKPESGMHAGGSFASIQTSGPSIPPPQPAQTSTFNRPVYPPPNSLWNARGMGHHLPPNSNHSAVMPGNAHATVQGPPFLPASVTPLAQIQASSRAPFDQMFSVPVVPPLLSSVLPHPPNNNMPPTLLSQSDFRPPLPPHPQLQPPLPPTPPPPPPPPPHSHPPAFPPPPNSPPPPSLVTNEESRSSSLYPWQGMLSKSGVFYCTIHAQRADSDICNYSNSNAEPAEWPAKLDMTKRTDLRHVMSTFSNTPSHRKEICWLLPSSHGDHKGLLDFISYLKQRECAGVIKIPAAKKMWARLLFILPYSPETCSFLSIPPNPSLCLIGLILPKETNSEMS